MRSGLARLFLLLIVCAGSVGLAQEAEALDAEGGWIRLPPPAAAMTAGYLTINNRGPNPVQIVGASSPRFNQVSIHKTVVVDGVSRMRSAGELQIEPGQSLVLEPGGYHLMLMRPRSPLIEGESVDVQLQLGGGARTTVTLAVRKK